MFSIIIALNSSIFSCFAASFSKILHFFSHVRWICAATSIDKLLAATSRALTETTLFSHKSATAIFPLSLAEIVPSIFQWTLTASRLFFFAEPISEGVTCQSSARTQFTCRRYWWDLLLLRWIWFQRGKLSFIFTSVEKQITSATVSTARPQMQFLHRGQPRDYRRNIVDPRKSEENS